MATPTIPNGEEYFFPIIYEGNGGGQRVGKFVPFTDNGTIDNSVIYNRSDSPKLARTPSSNGNRKTFTISVWYKPTDLGTRRVLFSADTSGSDYALFEINANNKAFFTHSSVGDVISTRTFEDTSKFYHFMLVVDTTQSTASDRVKIYVDGDLITSLDSSTYPSQDFQTNVNSTSYPMAVGSFNSLTSICTGGYLAEFNFVDGTALTPSTFGVTDTSTGRWIPKTLSGITYGTNGFRLEFGDSSALGDDTSGNTNDFTATNLASTDQTTDSPTQNFATLKNNTVNDGTLSEGNLRLVGNTSNYFQKVATLRPTSGKYYAEFTINSSGGGIIAVTDANVVQTSANAYVPFGYGYGWYQANGNIYDENVAVVTSGSTYTTGDVLAIALDLDNQEVKFYKNNVLDNTIGLNGTHVAMAVGDYSNTLSCDITANFGQKSFTYTPPTGFVALQQDNLPTTDKGVSGLVWAKSRDSASLPHQLVDSSRGVGNRLISSSTAAEAFNSNHLSRFLKGGYATGDINVLNTAGDSMVAWNWVADSGTTSTNTDGSITSTVQANTTAGFSIVEYTGTGSNATVGHGLSTAPKWIWVKQLNSTGHFSVYLGVLGGTKISYTSTSVVNSANSTYWNNTDATSSVFSVGTNADVNGSSSTYVAYCWSEIDGYSKFSSYTGNGNANGTFIYTGFKPAWVMTRSVSTATNWNILDTTRSPVNPIIARLKANGSDAESTNRNFDFLSNGFKLRESGTDVNQSGIVYAYMAFAEHPFVGDGTSPVTAR